MTKTATESRPNYSLFEHLQEIENQIEKLNEEKLAIRAELLRKYEMQYKALLKAKDDPFGVVHIEDVGFKISFTTPKKVEWDQKGLKKLYELGAPVEAEYNVPEAVFKIQDQDGRDALMPYRSVKPGNVSIKVEKL